MAEDQTLLSEEDAMGSPQELEFNPFCYCSPQPLQCHWQGRMQEPVGKGEAGSFPGLPPLMYVQDPMQ